MAELGEDVRSIRHQWWIVLIVTVLGGVIGFVITLGIPKQYQSEIQFFVATPSQLSTNLLEGNQFALQRASTYVDLLTSERLADMVLTDAKPGISRADLIGSIAAKNPSNTVLVDVTVTDTSPSRALRIVTSISTQFPNLVHDLETVQSTNTQTIRLELTSGPTLLKDPVSPSKTLNVGIGVLAGLAIGLIAVIWRGRRDKSLRVPAAVMAAVDAPFLGSIALDPVLRGRATALLSAEPTVRMESIRRLRATLNLDDAEHAPQVLLVTAPRSLDGKTATSVSLASSIAETGRSVVLVEADLRRPVLVDVLRLSKSEGLTEVLTGRLPLADAVQTSPSLGIKVLAAGSPPSNPAELLGSSKMVATLGHLRRDFDVIVVDSAPVLSVADSLMAGPLADGVIVLARSGRTTAEDLQTALASLSSVGAPVLGTVLNMAASNGPHAPLGMAEVRRLLPKTTAAPAALEVAPGRRPVSVDKTPVPAQDGLDRTE